MQKKKKKVTQGKEKSVKKAVAKPIVKKTAKKLAAPKGVPSSKNKKTATEVKPEVPAQVFISKIDPKTLTDEQLDNYKKWLKFQKQLGDKDTAEYKMSSDFELKTPLNHKIHGWGVVVQRRDNYIDVLFEAGLKTLIVNYK